MGGKPPRFTRFTRLTRAIRGTRDTQAVRDTQAIGSADDRSGWTNYRPLTVRHGSIRSGTEGRGEDQPA
ncbi:hypothetical protein YW7DRAFT_00634 [Streptomyces sp. AmelKG-E11A]|nr:hypothetical protein YW7DRAFT_00634 [Streptomyces sp. AmelKG-E11A]